MTAQTRALIFVGVWLLALFAGWIGRGWYEGNKKLSETNEAIVAGWRLQSDLNGALAKLAKAREAQLEKNNKVDKGYADYLKDPGRVTTRFDDKRVQLKNSAVDAANSIR